MTHIKVPTVIVFLLIASILGVSCSEQTGGKPDSNIPNKITEPQETDDPNPEPELPAEKFDGYEFAILGRPSAEDVTYREQFFDADAENGEPVNDAVYRRNLAAEEKFNITISHLEADPVGEMARKLIAAGDAVFDVLWEQRVHIGSLATGKMLYNIKNYPYIDYSRQYWDSNSMRELEIAGKLYFVTCDISLNNLAGARFLYFNKDILTDFSLPNPYELVYKNEWVLDTFLQMVRSVSRDLDGDGEMTNKDQYGMLTELFSSDGNYLYLLIGSGIRYTENDETGKPVLVLMNDRTVSVMQKLIETLGDTTCTMEYTKVAAGSDTSEFLHIYDFGRSRFAAGQFLFVQNGTNVAHQFSNMDADYGIVPNPKFDSSQERYYHKLDFHCTAMGIPVLVTEHERTGMILEYLAWLSSINVVPAYYEITIKTKRFRDDDASKMLDIVKDSLQYEVSDCFAIGIVDMLRAAFESGNLASEYQKQQKALQSKLDKTYEMILELEY